MKNYQIVRRFFRDDLNKIIIAKNLTLEEAQQHCCDPETSSTTCTQSEGLDRTAKCGPWFDGYEEMPRYLQSPFDNMVKCHKRPSFLTLALAYGTDRYEQVHHLIETGHERL